MVSTTVHLTVYTRSPLRKYLGLANAPPVHIEMFSSINKNVQVQDGSNEQKMNGLNRPLVCANYINPLKTEKGREKRDSGGGRYSEDTII
jgi:hypothetical protein